MKARPEILRAALDLAIASGHPDPWDLAQVLAQVAMACGPDGAAQSPPTRNDGGAPSSPPSGGGEKNKEDVPHAVIPPVGRGKEGAVDNVRSGIFKARQKSEDRREKIMQALRSAPFSTAQEVSARIQMKTIYNMRKTLHEMADRAEIRRHEIPGAGTRGLSSVFSLPDAGPVPQDVLAAHLGRRGRKPGFCAEKKKAGGWKGGYATRAPGSMAAEGVATEKREDGVTICPPRYAEGYGPECGRVNPISLGKSRRSGGT